MLHVLTAQALTVLKVSCWHCQNRSREQWFWDKSVMVNTGRSSTLCSFSGVLQCYLRCFGHLSIFWCCSIDGLSRMWPEIVCPFMYSLRRTSITCVLGTLWLFPHLHLTWPFCWPQSSSQAGKLCKLLQSEEALPCDSFSGESHSKNFQVSQPCFPQLICLGFLLSLSEGMLWVLMSWQSEQTLSRWGFW